MSIISKATFDITTISVVVTGSSGKQNYIVGLVIDNNVSTDTLVRVIMNTPAEDVYGTTAHPLYLHGYGRWGFSMSRDSIKHPYFISTTAGSHFILYPVGTSKRISGAVWYYQE